MESYTGESELNLKSLNPGTSATYCIRVKGRLDERLSERLGGLSITHTRHGDGSMITTLQGDLVDQAALFGVLNALYNMRLPLLSAEYLATSGGE